MSKEKHEEPCPDAENCEACKDECDPKDLKDPMEDFDTELFHKVTPAPPSTDIDAGEFAETPAEVRHPSINTWECDGAMCPYSHIACHKAGTSQCTKTCEHNPDNFLDSKIKAVFDKEPWSNYCFTCGEFVPSRRHEDALDPPELIYSHTVATGYVEYRTKLRRWTMERLTGKKEPDNTPDWKHTL